MAQDFAEQFDVEFPLYTDPDRRTYQLLGWRRPSIVQSLGKAGLLLRNSLRAFRAGHRQKGVRGDAQQIGGILVVGTDGEIHFRHEEAVAGDHGDIDAAIASIPAR